MSLDYPKIIYPKTPIDADAAPIDLSGDNMLGPYVRDTAQRHEFGRRMITWDGIVYKYMKAGGTLNPDMGCHTNDPQHVAYATVAASTVIGARQLKLDVAGTDGAAGDGVIAEDELRGGRLILFPHSSNSMNRTILGNQSVASGGGEMTLELEYPLNVATVVDVTHGECMASPYNDVRALTSGLRSVIAIPTVPAVADEFCWGQTWGPVWIAPQAEAGVGAHDAQCVFRHDGSIDEHDYNDANTTKQQHAGFVMSHAQDGSQGAFFLMLQISI